MNFAIILTLLFANLCFGQDIVASGSISLVNSFVTWKNLGEQTEFTITSKFDSRIDPSNAWLSLGVNSDPKMSGANAVVCQNTASGSSVSHHLNAGYSFPPLFDSSQPSLGLLEPKTFVVDRNLTCTFTRKNFVNIGGYFGFDSTTPLHIIVAFGQGPLAYHFNNRGSSINKVNFKDDSMNQNNTFITTPKTPSIFFFDILLRVLLDFFSRIFSSLF